ncbi:hypothetical protein BST98_19380 [Photobacterium damselae]|nr:hypothetical protein BST98_19380 [Photobacterium damselae]
MHKQIIYIVLSSLSWFSNAMTIDTMLKISDDNGTGVFSITNDLDDPSFIKIKPAKIVSDGNGNLKRIEYTKNNFDEWEISLTQSKVIVEPQRVKNIGVRSLCSEGCDRSKDTVYALKFLPTPYTKDGEKKKSVTINYGYEALFVIPAKKPEYKYNIKRVGDDILFENRGNSLIRVSINQCNGKRKSSCSRSVVVLSKRNKKILLPVNARQDVLSLEILGYDNSFYKKSTLSESKNIVRGM